MTSRTSTSDAAFDSILRRVVADLPQEQAQPRLFLDAAFADPRRHDAVPDLSDAVVEIGGSRTRIGLEYGPERGCQAVMSAVQDAVVDRTARPWPEILDSGGTPIGVLDVDLLPDGEAGWTLTGDAIGPVGQLLAACASRGWTVRA